MAERVSALTHLPQRDSADARVVLSERRTGSILQVAAWPETLETASAVIAELSSAAVPPVGSAVVENGVTIAAIAPGRYWLAGAADDLAPRFEAALPSSDGAVSDFSHGRVILRLDGEAAAGLLAKGVAIDLHPDAFAIGRVAQSMIHHIDVLIHRTAETGFELWVLRGFSEALGEWIIDAGLEFSIRFET